ncbi:hypothetical protein [Sulfuritalea sp.]|uniref:hypothetical protein n=1 Tax=Sulfuritalea sp. TaxID=2480090 RepID=UPI00286DFCCC|nr:hypothetical protein [Sulfuritalea sp.]
MKHLRSTAVEQSTLSSPLRILAVADGDTAALQQISNTAVIAASNAAPRVMGSTGPGDFQ